MASVPLINNADCMQVGVQLGCVQFPASLFLDILLNAVASE